MQKIMISDIKFIDKQDILDMINFARHYHVAGKIEIDICEQCGHDLRHNIHYRIAREVDK